MRGCTGHGRRGSGFQQDSVRLDGAMTKHGIKKMAKITTARKRAKYDWPTIQHEYVTSPDGDAEVTLEKLAEKYGQGAKGAIQRMGERSRREGWVEMRARHRQNAVKKAVRKSEETAAQRLERQAKIMRLIQAKGIKALQEDSEMPKSRDTIEAVKVERALYGEVGEVARIEITDRDKRMAAAYWKAHLDLMEKEADGD